VAAVVSLAQAGAPLAGPAFTDDESRAVVGTHVRTGETCPASGWWRCEEAHALDGTRWFARGSMLPVATFQVPAGVFAKADGPEVIQRRSLWQLVRRVEAPAMAPTLPRPTPEPMQEPMQEPMPEPMRDPLTQQAGISRAGEPPAPA
jgi:hypothetical protein